MSGWGGNAQRSSLNAQLQKLKPLNAHPSTLNPKTKTAQRSTLNAQPKRMNHTNK